MKITKILCSIIFVFFILAALVIGFLFTDKSSAVLETCIKKYGSDYVEVASIEGNLARNIQFDNVLIKTANLDIGLDRLVINWNLISLFIGQLPVETIKAKELTFSFKSSPEPTSDKKSSSEPFIFPLPEILVPYISVSLENLDIEGIAFIVDGDRQVEYLDRAKISGSIDGNKLVIGELTVDDTAYATSLSGSAITGTSWWADIKGTWRFSNWDGGELLGNLTAKGPLPDMDVTVQLLAPTFVDIKGKMTKLPGNPYFDVVGKGDKASLLVVHPACPDIRLDAFVKATGYINNYRGDLVSKGEYWKYKDMNAHGVLTGDLKGLKFENLTVKHEDSQVDLPGIYLDWDEDFTVGSKVVFKNIHPQVVDERFPGNLDGVIDGKLTVTMGVHDVLGEYSLKDFSGTLRGYPVLGNVNMQFTDHSLSFDEVKLSSGSSKILYKADFKDSLAMSLDFISPHFGEVLPESSGALEVNIKANGSYDNPNVSGGLSANELKVYDLFLGSVVGSLEEISNLEDGYKVDISAKDVSLYGVEAKAADAVIAGTLFSHTGKINLLNGAESGLVYFSGNFSDGLWTSNITDLSIKHGAVGEWDLMEDSILKLSGTSLDLSKTCLQRGDISNCWQASYSFDEGTYLVDADLENYDVSQCEFELFDQSGKLSANFSLQGDRGGLKAADGNISILDAGVEFGNSDQKYEDGVVKLSTIFDGEKIVTDLNMDVEEHSLVANVGVNWNGDFAVDWRDLPLTGRLDVRGVKLDFLGPMTDYDVESKGLVYGDFNVDGMLGNPLLFGDISLSSGYLSLAEQGLELRDIKLTVFSGTNGVDFSGELSSGPGKAAVDGNLDWYGTDLKGQLQLSGQNVEILNLPSYHIEANPDIDLTFDLKKAHVSGSVLIPRAEVTRDSSADTITESNDVVLVGVNTKINGTTGYQLESDLEVKLGDEVFLDKYGITGRLTGNFNLKDNSSNPMQAKGALSLVDGVVDIYGRKLDISRGQISFSGGSITNPSLDVRIQKEIRVQTEAEGIYNVGLDISGFADKPRYTLFSSPYMDDADILSYLLLGYSMFMATGDDGTVLANAASSMGWEKGAGVISKLSSILPIDQVHLESGLYDDNLSVVVGKNITSNLYIGYDYDVFNQLGEAIFRYNLYKGFYVVTKSSSEATGADLIYVWER